MSVPDESPLASPRGLIHSVAFCLACGGAAMVNDAVGAPHGFTGRRTERVAVNAEVALRRSGQLNYRVRVFDASPHGCRLEFVERPELEERVWVKFERLAAMEGIVCWVDGFHAGIEFASPMHQAVFDALVPRLG